LRRGSGRPWSVSGYRGRRPRWAFEILPQRYQQEGLGAKQTPRDPTGGRLGIAPPTAFPKRPPPDPDMFHPQSRHPVPFARRLAAGAAIGLLLALPPATGTAPLQGQEIPAELLHQPLPTDPAVRSGTLENGVRFLIRRNEEPRERAELRLVVDAGSILEDEDQLGLAHFVEHMAFNGTANFEKQELVRYLESVGMRFGPDLNAYTGFDETVYMLQLPTDDPEILATGVRILEEWAHRVSFDPEEVEAERGVIIEEWRGRRGAQARVSDQQVPVLFADSRYAERLPIGDTAVVRNASRETLLRFYRDWYRPDLMSVVAVGDFDPDWMEERIREHFQGIPPRENPRPRERLEIPGHPETRTVVVPDPELTLTQVGVVIKLPDEEDRGTVGGFRRTLLRELHDAMLNYRLFERTREADPPFLGAATGQLRLVRAGELLQLVAVVPDGGMRDGLAALLTEAERASRHGFTATELERQKTELLRRLERALAERERRASGAFASDYVQHLLEGEPIPGIEVEFELTRALLPTIGVEEVNRLAAARLPEENRVIVGSAPEQRETPLPGNEELLAVFAAVRGGEVEPYVDTVSDDPLMASLPTPGQVVSEEWLEELETHRWTLSNGVQVYVRPTDFRDDEILMQGWARGGTSTAEDVDLTAAQTAAALIGSSGAGEFDALSLDRRLAGTVASANPVVGELSQGIVGSASPQDLETLFQLLHLRFTAPRRDETRFQAYRATTRAVLANRAANPLAVFQDSLAVIMSAGHPRARPPGTHILDELDLDRSYDFYRKRFGDLAGWAFVFVGTVDPELLRPLVELYLGSLPASGETPNWVDRGVPRPTGIIRETIRRGLEPQSVTQILIVGEEPATDENQDLLNALGSVLEIRLRETLREELSATYGVNVARNMVRDPRPEYTVAVAFGSAPERAKELEDAVFQEMERLKSVGPSQEDLVRVREQHRREREVNQRQNAWWRSQLLNRHQYGTSAARITSPSLLEEISAEHVQEAARRFLRLENVVVLTLMPADEGEDGGGATEGGG